MILEVTIIMRDHFTQFDSKLFDILSESSPNTFFFAANVKENIARWSKGAVDYFGLESEILFPAEEKWGQRIHPDDYVVFSRSYFEMIHHITDMHDCEYRMKNAQGEYVWVNCRGKMTYDANNNPDFFAGFVTRLSTRNLIDSVTELWTIYSFRKDVEQMLASNKPGAIILINIQNFKKVNDEYGYSFGDKVLHQIGRILLELKDSKSSVYRMDGASFAFLMQEGTKEDMEYIYDSVSTRLENLKVENEIIRVGVQGGATLFPQNGRSLDHIQNHLFYAVEYAKDHVSNTVIFYNEEMHTKRRRVSRLKDAIKKSVKNKCKGFYLVLQPIMDKAGENCVAVESLLRFQTEEFGTVSPVEFIPILEESGDIIPVGKWVLSESLRLMSAWQNEMEATRRISRIHVNASYLQLIEGDFYRFAISKLKKYGLDPSCLVIELTESCRVDCIDQLVVILQKLKDAGICIALDDFGTGYASLSILKDIPTDMVKLDHTMTKGIENRPRDKQLVKYIISMCDDMDITVCAEGVENQSISKVVKDAGACFLQGYLYDKPLAEEDFKKKYL